MGILSNDWRKFPWPSRAPGCDALGDNPPVYVGPEVDGKTTFICRCVICGRCGRHTGNTTYGHFWKLCMVTGTLRTHHHCCPDGNCELEEKDDGTEGVLSIKA